MRLRSGPRQLARRCQRTFWSKVPLSRIYRVMLLGERASSPQSPVSPTTLPSSETRRVLSLFPRICGVGCAETRGAREQLSSVQNHAIWRTDSTNSMCLHQCTALR